jgi:endoglucanase
MISRRGVLTLGAGLGLSSMLRGALASEALGRDPMLPLWDAWKSIHLSSTGRVIDRLQDNISHSEGQGYALVLAEAFGDREGFDLILDWTVSNLAVRPQDALLAWRWHPANGGRVTDANNASDGDLFVAWALVRAADRFGEPRFLDMARAIAADLVGQCIRPSPDGRGGLVLIPGAQGFETNDGFVLNPAYYNLRAMRELGAVTGERELVGCSADGNAMLSTLARTRLVPDWVEVTEQGFAPVEGKSSDFGYEAMRVPLYLVWSGLPGHPAVVQAREAYLATFAVEDEDADVVTPTVIDPSTLRTLASSADPGYRALAALSVCAGGRSAAGLMPAFVAGQPYYPSVLHLLSLVAQREANLGCQP